MTKTAKPRRGKAAPKRQGEAKAKRERTETPDPNDGRDGRRNNGKNLKPWRFKAGEPTPNPEGRPRIERRKLNDDFVADMQEAWKISGRP